MAGFTPYFGYRDAKATISFLEQAFGFETRVAYEHEGQVVHAEMKSGDAFLMLGTGGDKQRREGDLPPAERGVYLAVEDVDAHF